MATDQTNNRNQVLNISTLDVACFVASFLLEGLQRCSGILFSGTLELSDESRQTAAVPFVVSRATAYISCVVAKSCLQIQKTESSLLFGAILCAMGAGLTFISNDVIWLTGCWGVIFGTGIGIAFPESLRVSQKYRSQTFILVLHSAAPSFACMTMPYLMLFLISSYGLSGCLLVLSGVVLNAAPFILTAIYKINFNLWKPKIQIRKKYEMSIPKQSSKMNGISNGIDNEGFELENSSEVDTHVSNVNTRETRTVSSAELTHNGVTTVDVHNQTDSNKYPKIKPQFEGLDEVIRKLGRDPGSITEENDHNPNINLFERSFSEEDVLFEVLSDGPKKPRRAKTQRSGSNKSMCANVDDSKLQKRTVSVPIKHTAKNLQTKTISELPINEGSGPSKELDVSVSNNITSVVPKANDDVPVMQSLNQSFAVSNSIDSKPGIIHQNFPLKIKVHVVECTFTASELKDCELLDKVFHKSRKNGYRRHSNSLNTSSYDNIDFTSPTFLKKFGKSSSICRHPSNMNSRMYLISEDEELRTENNNSTSRGSEMLSELSNPRQPPPPKSTWLKHFKKLPKPSCLVILYSFVIYELTLITLLTIFDDLVTDAGVDGAQAIGVLPAFGLGGIVGRLSLRYWGDRLLLEGSHATAAVLFILDGVVIAGILWSPNLYWIGGFYAALGFLEVGISTTIWNLVSDYIEEEVKSVLFSTCTLVCGICTLFVPSTIGMSRDDLGEYDGLLQITSGLSVLCAVLCYVLPRFVSNSRHTRGS